MSAGEPAPTSLGAWLDRHTARAPEPLRSRVRQYAEYAASAAARSQAEALAQAGQRALDVVLAHPGDRSAALDLLAADALVTLALLAQAEQAPERLGGFAEELLRAGLTGA
ncbi:MAG TPA: hypothetical protein VFK09_08405 [Gemmatimonadales bacterium]|nr:hypothetical protein [Gemmatimonadales bacterium]